MTRIDGACTETSTTTLDDQFQGWPSERRPAPGWQGGGAKL
jgi:hypothetical protein